MLVAFHIFFSKNKIQYICISLDVNFNESLTNDIVSFEQLGPGIGLMITRTRKYKRHYSEVRGDT